MYDTTDTSYYLSEGNKVIAVEANPAMIDKAKELFKKEITSGQLVLVDAAICESPRDKVIFNIAGDDVAASSIFGEKISSRGLVGSCKVRGLTIKNLINSYGMPYFMKVDIEGCDRFCVLPLSLGFRPKYISFEASDDVEELVLHLEDIGFTKFKAINQCNFKEFSNQNKIFDRIKRKIINILGYKDPMYIRCNGRFFKKCHSSGPLPWVSDGYWCNSKQLLAKWNLAKSQNKINCWYDIHAM